MTDTLHWLVEQYGLLAVFLGCLAEGESAAILGGFFAHQGVFVPWQAFATAAVGAFLGDTAFYLTGRYFSDSGFVNRLRGRPGFSHVLGLVRDHPAKFVMLNRYAYGFRLIGGVASGLARIAVPKFLVLNALSSLIWAALFGTIGWFFGLGAEQLLGRALHDHHRLIVGLGIGVAVAVIAGLVAHHYAGKGRD
jgi:membrane protein DedA with SNARE-associated domain